MSNSQLGTPVGGNGQYRIPEGTTALALIQSLLEMCYKNWQIDQEARILIANGADPDAAETHANEHRGQFDRFRRVVQNDLPQSGTICVWGAAGNGAKQLFTQQLWEAIAEELVCTNHIPPTFAHGDSDTGNMGVGDRGIVRANEIRRGLPIFGESNELLSAVLSIPLNWPIDVAMDLAGKTHGGRESSNKSNDPDHRCPQWMSIELRTMIFSMVAAEAKRLSMFCLLPGGLGTRFEALWKLLSGQLRGKLLTCFSDLNGVMPPMLLIDYYHVVDRMLEQWDAELRAMRNKFGDQGAQASNSFVASLFRRNICSADDWCREIEVDGLNIEDFGISDRWHWEGFRRDVLSMVIGGCCQQVDVSDITILRVHGDQLPLGAIGSGETPRLVDVPRGRNLTSDLSMGAKVSYFDSVGQVATHVNCVYQERVDYALNS